MNLQELNQIRESVSQTIEKGEDLKKYSKTAHIDALKKRYLNDNHSDMQKSETPFEKARGTSAFIGEIRIFSGKKWVKTADGWVYQNKNGSHAHYNSKTRATQVADENHVNHYHEHINKDADAAIESHAKGDLPKEEVDKHFEEKESPKIFEIGDAVNVTDKDKSGIILKLPSSTSEFYSIDFGNGNVYGIMPSRILSKKEDKKTRFSKNI